jgi:hypothetical protein
MLLDLRYIAGLIDADGSFSISASKARYKRKDGTESSSQISFVVNFRQVRRYEYILEAIQQTLGVGKIYKFSGGGSAPMVTWQTTKESEALLVCQTLLPYLEIKKPQARYMIDALEIWEQGRLDRKGAGYLHTDQAKQDILTIASLMNPSQQKNTSRRNKDIRSIVPDSWVEDWADPVMDIYDEQ